MAEDFNKDRVTVLIDGNSVIYRAFYNVPPLTAGGVPTGANVILYGFFILNNKNILSHLLHLQI